MHYVLVAPALGLILLTSTFGFDLSSAATTTTVSLDDLPSFPVNQGETVTFTGRLIEASNLSGISNANVTIVHQISYNNREAIISGTTDQDGYYSIPWVADVEKVAPVSGGSFGLERSEGADVRRFQVKVIAEYTGDDQFSQSVSNAQSFEIRLNQIKINVEKRTSYLAFESFTIKARITDVDNKLIDPDTLTASFDRRAITLVRESEGLYSFAVTSLPPGQHSFDVSAQKAGYISDQQRVTIEAMKRTTILNLSTDKSSYKKGDEVVITAELTDTSTSKLVSNKIIMASLKTSKDSIKTLTFVDGKATYTILDSDPVGTWSILVNFAGDNAYFGSSDSASFTVEKGESVVTPPPVGEKVALEAITLLDQNGEELDDVLVGQTVQIQAKMTSNVDTTAPVTYITQVRNSEGITVALSWVTRDFSAGQSAELAVSWTPKESGDYAAEVFVWKSVTDPEPLSFEVKRATIVVRG